MKIDEDCCQGLLELRHIHSEMLCLKECDEPTSVSSETLSLLRVVMDHRDETRRRFVRQRGDPPAKIVQRSDEKVHGLFRRRTSHLMRHDSLWTAATVDSMKPGSMLEVVMQADKNVFEADRVHLGVRVPRRPTLVEDPI